MKRKLKADADPQELVNAWARATSRIFAKYQANPEASNDENFKGFIDGISRRTIPHPYPGVPDVLHSMDPSYIQGFELGESFADIAEISEMIPKPKKKSK